MNELKSLHPELEWATQVKVEFNGYSTTMKADVVGFTRDAFNNPIPKIIAESKFNTAKFSSGQKMLFLDKDAAIMILEGQKINLNYGADLLLQQYRYMWNGTRSVISH